ncbi:MULTISPECIES: NAD(P)-dependent oxidoreductase [Pandoraea]|uniref:NAD-dependent epimerase/dehydratase family protein n=1 Tax=Pandoraea TaxID=93217 RepID=UPI001F5C65B0|nr:MULTISPECIES: NAD(P)-dependent oxidoreductase [Pandoraea]MCI3205269.1 NAD-dependent dehydratase [Pandoraea sp. LA3]MDN4583297.1 NAD-dependent dehydratase [Pandoraea capi]
MTNSKAETIVVTGAAGLLGAAVARKLKDRGDDVIAIDRTGGHSIDGLDVIRCDLTEIHRLHELTRKGVSAIIHCGAYSGPMVARDEPYSMVQVNIVGTANMLEIARIHQARRFVFCSSTSAYGHIALPEGGRIGEDSPLKPESLYGASKVASEYLVESYAKQYGVDGVSARISWVYGPRRTTDCVIRTMLTDALHRRPTRMPFGSDFHRQFIHIDDAANGLIRALDAPTLPRRTYNITGGSRVTFSQIAEIVRAVVPEADIQLQAGPDCLDESQGLFDISAAQRDLGYSPQVSLEAGIERYAAWLRQQSTTTGG